MKTKHSFNITLAIFLGLVLGILFGLFMPGRYEGVLPVIDLLSGLYMNALRMMIYPLVFCSLIAGIQGIGSVSATGRVGGQAVLYFTATTLFASLLGLFLPKVLNLGSGVSIEMVEANVEATQFTSLMDTVKNLIPSNPVAAFAEGNMLQVLVFAVIVGVTALAIGEKAKPAVDVIVSLNEIFMKIITVVMQFTPLGVLCTIAPVVAANGIDTVVSLIQALAALYIAFFAFAFIVYGGIVKAKGGNPIRFFRAIMPAALNAFGTCSSSATIPLSKKCAEEELGVSNKITSIVLPLGATINMDAVSILMSFMITFFANACNVQVSISLMIVVLLSNVLLSIGTPGVPGGAIASFAALASIAGLPSGVMGIYISVNTLCDMGATCVNVLGDLACAEYLNRTMDLD